MNENTGVAEKPASIEDDPPSTIEVVTQASSRSGSGTCMGEGHLELPRPDRLRASAVLLGGLSLIAVGLGVTAFAGIAAPLGAAPFVAGPVGWALAAYNGAFHPHITRDEFRMVPIAALAAIGATLGWVAAAAVVGFSVLGLANAIGLSLVIAVSLLVGLIAGRRILRKVWRRGSFRSTAVVAGAGIITSELALELAHRNDLGIDVIEQIDLGHEGISSIVAALRRHRPDRLVLGEVGMDEEALLPVIRFAGTMGIRVYILPRLFAMGIGNPLFSPDRLRGFPLHRVNRTAHPQLAFALKRAMDIGVSSAALTVLAPLLLAVAVLTKITSPGPLLFWQERVGRNEKHIRIPKFRSMRHSDSSDGEWTADDRITSFGRFLRRSAIDEIPQLWSVLRGDMSLVGPRPERPLFASQFAEEHAEYGSRLRMRAGLTGLAQIAGLRGDTGIAERAKYDNLYIDQWSLSGDLMILVRTVGAIVNERRQGQAHLDFEAALSTLQLNADPICVRTFGDGELNETELTLQGRRSSNA